MEPSVAIDVPLQVERTRRVSALALRRPIALFNAVLWSIWPTARLFGFSRTTMLVLAAFWTVWSSYGFFWRFRQLSWLRRVRVRAASEGWIRSLEGPAYLLWAYATLGLAWPRLWLEPPGTVLTAILWLPTVVMLGASWWWAGWWPRLALAALYGTALVLLPLWMPVPARRFDAIALGQCMALAAWSALNHVELRLLLRGTGDAAEAEEIGGHA